MTVIDLVGLESELGAPGPIERGRVVATYWAGMRPFVNVAGAEVTFPAPIVVQVTDGDPDEVLDMTPTGGVCCVRWEVRSFSGGPALTRYTSIPASGPVDFGDLPIVDPKTFLPIDVTPSLTEYVLQLIADNAGEVDPADIEAAVVAYLSANPIEIADVTGLAAALAGKAATSHGHVQSDVSGLVAALAALAPLVHTHVQGDVSGLTAALAALAPLASPSFTGNPLAPTPSPGDNDTSIATTGFVKAALDALIASAPGTLDTLDELAAALGDDPNFAASITTALALKAPLNNPAFTGTVTGVTKAHVGLGNVDNTADTAKPVSTAQQTALNLKLDTSAAPELIRDTMGTALVAGTNVTITPDDGADTITISATGGGGGGITVEDARDAVAAMLVVNGNATGTNNDAGDTYTINVPGNPLYIQSGTPTPTAPALWVKDLGSGAFSLHIVTP